jgi:hypothetical protein
MKKKNILLGVLFSVISASSFAQRGDHGDQRREPPRQEQKGQQEHFYYIPEYNAYYDAIKKLFFYEKGNKWKSTKQPKRFAKDFDINKVDKKPIQNIQNEGKPYLNNQQDKKNFRAR